MSLRPLLLRWAACIISQQRIGRNTLPQPDVSTHSLRPPQPTQPFVLCFFYTHINITYSLHRLSSWWGLHLFEAGAAGASNSSLSSSSTHTHTFTHSLTCAHTHSVVHQMACMNDDLSQLQILNQGVISWIPEVFLFVYRRLRSNNTWPLQQHY